MTSELYGKWGRALRRYREAAELSRKQAAQRLEVSEATLSRWEAGIVMPSDPMKITVAEVYGVEPRTLFPLERTR